eukprot:UN25120
MNMLSAGLVKRQAFMLHKQMDSKHFLTIWKKDRDKRQSPNMNFNRPLCTIPHLMEDNPQTKVGQNKENIKHLLNRDTPYPKLVLHRMEAPHAHPTTIQKEENIEEFWHGRRTSLRRKIDRNDFNQFGLEKRVMKRLISKKYWSPTPIQTRVIPILLKKQHCIIQSQTGTGKTLAYVIPALNRRMQNKKNQTVVVVPTRELGEQIVEEFKQLLPKPNKKDGEIYQIKEQVLLVSRAEPFDYHVDIINSKNPPIVVGTAHRLKELFSEGILDPTKVEYLVLDEVDQLFDPIPRTAKATKHMHRARHPKPAYTLVRGLLRINPDLQIVSVGATINQQLRYQIKTLCAPKPVEVVTTGTYQMIPSGITHKLIVAAKKQKTANLIEYIKQHKGEDGGFLVFLQNGTQITKFAQTLTNRGFKKCMSSSICQL